MPNRNGSTHAALGVDLPIAKASREQKLWGVTGIVESDPVPDALFENRRCGGSLNGGPKHDDAVGPGSSVLLAVLPNHRSENEAPRKSRHKQP